MIDIYAESKSTKARLWYMARKGGDVMPDDGIGARQIAGLCGAVSAALIAKTSPKGLREWLSLSGPYTFTLLTGDRMLPLNRYYKPLGLGSAQWVEYENFAALAVPTGQRARGRPWRWARLRGGIRVGVRLARPLRGA